MNYVLITNEEMNNFFFRQLNHREDEMLHPHNQSVIEKNIEIKLETQADELIYKWFA